jgi:hypothetical protein
MSMLPIRRRVDRSFAIGKGVLFQEQSGSRANLQDTPTGTARGVLPAPTCI